MRDPVIVVDVGNTSTALALASGSCRIGRMTRLATQGQNRRTIAAALTALVRGRAVEGSILCSVAPAVDRLWLAELRRLAAPEPLRVNCRMRLGIAIEYPRPATIGADRLANACAVAERYGVPAIVADFGTALTFDIVSEKRAYVGGVIAPGLPLMTEYLAERTARLPWLDLRRAAPAGRRRFCPIGKSTRQAMLAGARLGYIGMVREITGRLLGELRTRRVRLCATGGYAAWVLSGSGLPFRIDPDLTLYGISRIYELNVDSAVHATTKHAKSAKQEVKLSK